MTRTETHSAPEKDGVNSRPAPSLQRKCGHTLWVYTEKPWMLVDSLGISPSGTDGVHGRIIHWSKETWKKFLNLMLPQKVSPNHSSMFKRKSSFPVIAANDVTALRIRTRGRPWGSSS